MTQSDRPSPTSSADALRVATRRLRSAGLETPRLDAEVLLRHVLGLDRIALFLRLLDPIETGDLNRFDTLVHRRMSGEPVAYLTGTREFLGISFAVQPGVLIPRPETEILVEWALGWLATHSISDPFVVADIGVGSGAIVLSLARLAGPGRPGIFIGADRSATALAVARENRSRLDLVDRVALVRGDLLAWRRGPVHLLLANLPYLRPDQVAGNPVLAAEPRMALVGGSDGLDLLRRLIADAPRVLVPGGAMGLEIDPSQSASVVALVKNALPDADIAVLADLAGLARHVVAVRPVSNAAIECPKE